MDLRGAVLLGEERKRGISNTELVRADILGFKKDGITPIYAVKGSSLQTWEETLTTAQAAGTQLVSFTTAASVLPPPARIVLPAGYWSIGKMLRIKAMGGISNIVTAQPTFTATVVSGPTTNITVFNGGTMTTSTTAHTNVPWYLELFLTGRALGNSTNANLMGQGCMTSQAFVVSGATADSASSHTSLMIPNTAPAVGTGFDSTVANTLDLFFACSVSNAANNITLHQYSVEAMN